MKDNLDSNKLDRIQQISIERNRPVIDALKQMDAENSKLLLVTSDGEFASLLSVGDVQRAIIGNRPLSEPIGRIVREAEMLRLATVDDSFDSVKKLMLEFRMEFMPVLGPKGELADVYFWNDVFTNKRPNRRQINQPVVIMAGGKGTRLKPFSNVLPKPLFPLGEKTIVENIIDRFKEAGCDQFLMSVNYKADFIEAYFDQDEVDDYQIHFFREETPLGTAGSLRLIDSKINETFFVTNCDIMIDADYSEIVDYHRAQQNEITLVAALKHLQIPYGTVETAEGGKLCSIKEKPELTHLINAGMYVLEPGLLKEIPENNFFHITQLIERLMENDRKVGVFPISEKSWSDIGEWNQYNQTLEKFKLTV